MSFRGEIHHRVWFELGHQRRHSAKVANIFLGELIKRVIRDARNILEIGGVSQLVHIKDSVAGGNRLAHNRRTNKSGTAGNHKPHGFLHALTCKL